jgi:hypothetical protein
VQGVSCDSSSTNGKRYSTHSTYRNDSDIVESDPRLGTLENLLIAQGLLNDLEGPGPLTPFAPTNEAFSALDIQPGMPTDNFRMNTRMVDTAPLIIWLV